MVLISKIVYAIHAFSILRINLHPSQKHLLPAPALSHKHQSHLHMSSFQDLFPAQLKGRSRNKPCTLPTTKVGGSRRLLWNILYHRWTAQETTPPLFIEFVPGKPGRPPSHPPPPLSVSAVLLPTCQLFCPRLGGASPIPSDHRSERL